jgi:lactate dehydrogenase-like 2-hydroxyacid dehydrogenase
MSRPVLLSTGLMMPLMVEAISSRFDAHWMHEVPDAEKLIEEIGPRVEAVCTGAHTAVRTTDAMMARMPRLKVIGNFGVGYDSIDIPAAAARGVVITNTPDVLNEEVADIAVGLLIATLREFYRAEEYLRAGRWAKEGDYRLTPGSLRDRTVGVIGMGRIGKAIARRLEAFGVKIAYFARNRRPEVAYPYYADLVAMARDVDTLIAILPGGPATANLVNAEVLAALGPNGVFINAARGSVVDEAALKAALRNGTILAAGLDVYLDEPRIDPDLMTVPNLTLLPHVGSASQLTRSKMGQLVVDNLFAYLDRKPPPTPVPETPFKGW